MKRRLLNWLDRNKFWRNVSVLAGSTAAGQILAIIATPIVTRLYKPEDFGLVAIYTSVLGITGAFVCLSYQIAILTPEDEADAVNLLALCLLITISVSAIASIIIYWGGGSIAQLLGEPKLAEYLWLIPLSILLLGFYSALNFWAVRRKAFTRIARTKINQSISGITANIGLGLLGLRPLGLFIGTILGQSAGIISLARLAWANDSESLRLTSLSGMKGVSIRYIRFPLLTTPTALINAAGSNFPAILLTAFYGTQVTGWFSLGQRLVLIPSSLVGIAVGQVYLGEIASLAYTNPQEMYNLFVKTITRLALVSLIPASVFLIGGGHLVELVFGQEWFETGVYLRFLSISFIIGFVATPVSQIFSLFERQDLALIWNIARLGLIVGSLYVVNRLGLSARIAILFFAISMMLVDMWRLFLVSKVIRTREQVQIHPEV